MKTKIIFLAVMLVLVPGNAFARRAVPQEPVSHFSENKHYEVQIFEQTIVDRACKAILKKGNQAVWVKFLPSTPGIVHVLNDGQIVFVNWGWADEGGFKSVSFYDGSGNERAEFKFGNGDDDRNMKHIRKSKLTPDERYFLIVDSAGTVTFYDVTTPKVLWERKLPKPQKGYYGFDDIKISDSAGFILLSAYNSDEAEAFFTYMDQSGEVLWEKRIPKGYPLRRGFFGMVLFVNEKNQKLIALDAHGKNFSIYSLPESKWIKFENNDGKVTEIDQQSLFAGAK